MRGDRTAGARHFLFLQGLATPFSFRLARRLSRAGHRTTRVHVSGADLVFWWGRAILYRGRLADWPVFVADLMKGRGVTDLVLFGDCRPYHRAAIEAAERLGLRVHVFEEGYLRPGWITLERGGTNGYSRLSRDPRTILERAARLTGPEASSSVRSSFFNRAAWDVGANIVGFALSPLFPHYRWHGPTHPFREYAGWMARFARAPGEGRRSRRVVDALLGSGKPFFLVPLQLHSDYQIRVHSRFESPFEPIEDIIASFARHATGESQLLFKLHPLDPGLIPYAREIAAIAGRHGVADRMHFIKDGHLPTLTTRSEGVVLVNSSAGLLALQLGKKLKALGRAIYDMPGLTFQEPLDRFWTSPDAPDPELVLAFHRVLIAQTQITGDFFTRDGIERGTAAAAARMLAGDAE
ncbi:capsular polysaccharide export protein [Faunimonas pinastri]|uniref:Capsular polysaccharide export protein n=1 Tax=Faunimonas pinastri TaxID=1855383 RepID=A0A1H9FF45_9HYPH|nr:capsular biosynthesis protein [Faunimonas pinastri]SEQ36550.1 capsular polysaccharide export protein [Faunimonas pinastri]